MSVSLHRIQKYLESPEMMPGGNKVEGVEDLDVVTLKNVTCYWDESNISTEDNEAHMDFDRPIALSNISLSLRKNELTCIVGAVGSGKSALLYALAGELALSSGSLRRYHSSLAYAAQDPWIMNGM